MSLEAAAGNFSDLLEAQSVLKLSAEEKSSGMRTRYLKRAVDEIVKAHAAATTRG